MKILALGDCNTFGDVYYKNNAYPERFGQQIGAQVNNCGYTMSTTREMGYFAEENIHDADIVLIQYGLVDSWKTFKYAPYVLYYPDNTRRKLFRKIVKKYKKIAKKLGLNTLLGSMNVVPIEEYRANIEKLLSTYSNKIFFLLDTVPNNDLSRNDEIMRYNAVLEELSKVYSNAFHVEIYDHFLENLDQYYVDPTHINEAGYNYMATELIAVYNTFRGKNE